MKCAGCGKDETEVAVLLRMEAGWLCGECRGGPQIKALHEDLERLRRDHEKVTRYWHVGLFERHRVLAALEKYGEHDMECALEGWRFAKLTCPTFDEMKDPKPACSCGLDEFLKR